MVPAMHGLIVSEVLEKVCTLVSCTLTDRVIGDVRVPMYGKAVDAS